MVLVKELLMLHIQEVYRYRNGLTEYNRSVGGF